MGDKETKLHQKIKDMIEMTIIWSTECEGLTVLQARSLIGQLNARVLYVVDHPPTEDE